MHSFRTSFALRTRVSLVAAATLVAGLLVMPAPAASAAGPATHLSVVPDASSVTAGGTISFTVTALDASEATDTSYTGTVDITVSDPQTGETVPQTYPFTGGDAGSKSLSGTLTLAGTRTITATDESTASITGSAQVEVTPGNPAKLKFSSEPTNTYSGHTINSVSVQILDANDNLTDSTDQIQLTANGGGFDAGTDAVAASGGVATFSDLVLDTPGSYTLGAADTSTEGVTPATSQSFDVLAHADIALTMTASPDGSAGHPAIAGTNEAYTVTVTNGGPDMNSTYSVTASIPAGTTLVSAPGCTGSGPITCSGGPLDNEASEQFVITLHIGSDYAGADNSQSLSFTANVSVTDPTQDPDNNTSNDTATQTFDVIGRADLSNTLTVPTAQQVAGAGAGVDYTLKVKNDGPSDNFGYQSVFSLPSQVSFDSFSTTSGGTCSAASAVVTCSNTGAVGNGSTDTYTVHAKIAASKPPANDGSTAEVSTTSTPDPNSANDTSTPQAVLHVITRADLSITKTAAAQLGTSQDLAYANNNVAQNRVTFTVTVKNADTNSAGPSDAQAVKVTDTPPTGTSFVPAESSSQCALVSGVVTCQETGSPALVPGASRTYTIVVKVSSTLRGGETNNFTNTAGVTSTTQDINGATYPKTATSGTIRVHTVPDAPTNANASPGNGNAFYLWKQSLSSNGGETINNFTVTTTPSSPTSPITVGTTDSCGTNNSSFFCTNIAQLTNTTTYTLSVTANNAVGSSTPLTASVTPTVDASAQQINAGHLSQHTGNSTLPSKNDPQISFQEFPSNTTGVGTILENNQGAALFCGGPCVGKIVQTKLEDPNLSGVYQITLLYDKTLVGGTGQKYTFFYAPNATDPAGTALKPCPKTVGPSTQLPCVTVKLGSTGANPALKAIIYTRDVDPTIGGRAYPK